MTRRVKFDRNCLYATINATQPDHNTVLGEEREEDEVRGKGRRIYGSWSGMGGLSAEEEEGYRIPRGVKVPDGDFAAGRDEAGESSQLTGLADGARVESAPPSFVGRQASIGGQNVRSWIRSVTGPSKQVGS